MKVIQPVTCEICNHSYTDKGYLFVGDNPRKYIAYGCAWCGNLGEPARTRRRAVINYNNLMAQIIKRKKELGITRSWADET
jgi:hypothetical protein